MPGVPEEMVEMMEGTILPELASEAGEAVVRSRVLRCAGIGESALAERVDDLPSGLANPTIVFAGFSGEAKVRITAKAATAEAAEQLIEPIAEEVRGRLGDDVFTTEDETLEGAVVRLLTDAGATLRAPSRSPAGAWARASRACRACPRRSSGRRWCIGTKPKRRCSESRGRRWMGRGR